MENPIIVPEDAIVQTEGGPLISAGLFRYFAHVANEGKLFRLVKTGPDDAVTVQTEFDSLALVAAERHRQIDVERFDAGHDADHEDNELALAAACYAAPFDLYRMDHGSSGFAFLDPWPWDSSWDKRQRDLKGQLVEADELPREARIRNLVKAGALILAEIDRLRAAPLYEDSTLSNDGRVSLP